MSKDLVKKLLSILNRKQKQKIAGLIIIILFGGILETIGVSLILPLISAILDEATFAQNEYVQMIMSMLHITNIRVLVYLLIFLVIGMYIFKGIFLVFSTYLQSRFVNRNRCQCTTNLLRQYLNKPYEYYLYAETSTILRTIYGDMDNVFNLLMQCLNFIAELVVSICLGVFLFVMDPALMVVIVGLLLVTTIFISKVVKPKLNRVGEDARGAQADLYKWILQSVTGIKDVKVANKQEHFINGYQRSASEYAGYQIQNNVLTNIPRLLIESIAICGILLYVVISMMAGTPMSDLLPLISAFAMAAMRLLPSVNRLNTYMANIAYYEPALNYIYDNVDTEDLKKLYGKSTVLEDKEIARLTLKNEIRLEDITFAYPNTDKNIFDKADMKIPVGKSVGVVGASGAGKTTIVDVLLGLLELQSGTITSDGTNIFDNYGAWLSHVGYIPQTIYMLDDSIRNNIAFGVKEEDIDDARVWEVLEQAQMKTFVEELPDKLDSQIGERGVRISGGQRQRLGIARALYHDPELLIFDEATSALDNDTETAIMEAIDSLHGQKTMVIIAHRLRTIENCDMIYEVKNGKISQTR